MFDSEHKKRSNRNFLSGSSVQPNGPPSYGQIKIGEIMKKVAFGIALIFSLTACQTTNQTGGNIIGGVLGGALGSQVGKGKGQIAAIVVGTLIGAAVGGKVGKSMDDVDRMKVSRTLETSQSNRTNYWTNPDSGNEYTVTPQPAYQSRGRPCREYTMDARVDGRSQQVVGTACRNSNGQWVTQ